MSLRHGKVIIQFWHIFLDLTLPSSMYCKLVVQFAKKFVFYATY